MHKKIESEISELSNTDGVVSATLNDNHDSTISELKDYEYFDKIEDRDEEIRQLEKQLEWYRSFFDKATDSVFIVKPETWTIYDANEQAAALMGKPKEKLIGTSLPQFKRIFKLLQKSSSPVVLSELTFETESEVSVMLEVNARFIEFDGKRLIQAIARDISEQYALTEKLVQSDKLVLLGQLLAGVTHEIRNPLAAVNLNLQKLSRDTNKKSPGYNNIQNALQGVERISKIVEVTLNFSRPAVLDIQGLSLNSIIPTVLELVSSILRKRDIEIVTRLEDTLPNIQADSRQLQQVLVNLITNAIDAIGMNEIESQHSKVESLKSNTESLFELRDRGKIIIKTYREKEAKSEVDYAVVSIADNGIGIAPEVLPKIFNPFFTRKIDGTGLGLPITQRIIHQHRGIIDVESRIGVGTTFYIKFLI